MPIDVTLLKLLNAQRQKVEALEADLAQFEADGNEFYAAQVRDELVVARSPARLVHKRDDNAAL